MKNIQHIEVFSRRKVKFEFDLVRNITVVKGNSGTGKTTLYQMISDYNKNRDVSGVTIVSEKQCIAVESLEQIKKIKDSIVFIDEGSDFVKSHDFAKLAKKSDNYYVIIMRDELHELPYSVTEIYYIKTSGKFHTFAPVYVHDNEYIYETKKLGKGFNFDTVLVEDSNSGYEFYKKLFDGTSVKVEYAGANSNIYKWLKINLDKHILVIADGAAFGSEMSRIMLLQAQKPKNIKVCLPESFEWLILKSGLVKGKELVTMLENPSDFIESKDFFDWEKYFTKCLIDNTTNTPFNYQKKRLNKIYLLEENQNRIIEEIKSILSR